MLVGVLVEVGVAVAVLVGVLVGVGVAVLVGVGVCVGVAAGDSVRATTRLVSQGAIARHSNCRVPQTPPCDPGHRNVRCPQAHPEPL